MTTIKPNTKIRVKGNLKQINDAIESVGYPTLGIGNGAKWIFLHENFRTSWSGHDCFPDFQEIFIDLPNHSEKPNSSEWVDGLPPAGTECLVNFNHGLVHRPNWIRCVVVGHIEGESFYLHGGSKNTKYTNRVTTDPKRFKPIENEEQAAKRKRDELAESIASKMSDVRCHRIQGVEVSFSHCIGDTEKQYASILADWLLKTGQLKESQE